MISLIIGLALVFIIGVPIAVWSAKNDAKLRLVRQRNKALDREQTRLERLRAKQPEAEAFHSFVDGEFATRDPGLWVDREDYN